MEAQLKPILGNHLGHNDTSSVMLIKYSFTCFVLLISSLCLVTY